MKNIFKKSVSIFLMTVLLLSLAVPAFAVADTLDKDLERITLLVKETLGIDNRYTEFNGDYSDREQIGYWNLYWSNEDESLQVSTDNNGKVLSYYRYVYEKYERENGYAPVFNEVKKEQAQAAAKQFLNKVLSKDETAQLNDYNLEFVTYKSSDIGFYGNIYLNGLKSPISLNITVNAKDFTVRDFSRSDKYSIYDGGIPSSTPKTTADAAGKKLGDKAELQLQYVLDDEGKKAVLRYMPIYNGDYAVNADTGELIRLDEMLYDRDGGYGGNASFAADEKSINSGLSEAEQKTITALEGVMSKEQLDAKVKSITELGLNSSYTLNNVQFYLNKEDESVTCYLGYIKKISDKSEIKKRYPETYNRMVKNGDFYPVYLYKYLTINAKTGDLLSIYTSTGDIEKNVLTASKLQKSATDFLQKYYPDMYSLTTLNNVHETQNGMYTFTHTVNDVVFPQNSLNIAINSYDGTVDSFSYNWWQKDVEFDTTEGIISSSAAKEAYLNCFKPELQYVSILSHEANTTTDFRWDDIHYKLMLAYKLESADTVLYIDAKTGEPEKYVFGEKEEIVYDDIEGCYGKKQIEKLALYGIGFGGTSFKPKATLTQKDALVLLLSAVGYRFENDKDDEQLYSSAYYYGFITKSDKNPKKELTRAEFVKMLISATEYKVSANLEGIYKTGFKDEKSIPGGYLGFVAIAKALGIVNGDANGNFNPNAKLSRQDGAIMLYNFMSRK